MRSEFVAATILPCVSVSQISWMSSEPVMASVRIRSASAWNSAVGTWPSFQACSCCRKSGATGDQTNSFVLLADVHVHGLRPLRGGQQQTLLDLLADDPLSGKIADPGQCRDRGGHRHKDERCHTNEQRQTMSVRVFAGHPSVQFPAQGTHRSVVEGPTLAGRLIARGLGPSVFHDFAFIIQAHHARVQCFFDRIEDQQTFVRQTQRTDRLRRSGSKHNTSAVGRRIPASRL